MYYCVLTTIVLVYITMTLLFGLCPFQNITKLCLENSLKNLTYFQNVISNPDTALSHNLMKPG
jgi:hypothetical protein